MHLQDCISDNLSGAIAKQEMTMSTRKIHTWSTLSYSICHAVSSTITSRNITQHRKQNVFFRFCGKFWVVLAGFVGGFGWF